MYSDQIYLDTTFRVSTRITQEQYDQLIADGIIKKEQDETIVVEDYQALTEFVDNNRTEDDCYIENVEIGE